MWWTDQKAVNWIWFIIHERIIQSSLWIWSKGSFMNHSESEISRLILLVNNDFWVYSSSKASLDDFEYSKWFIQTVVMIFLWCTYLLCVMKTTKHQWAKFWFINKSFWFINKSFSPVCEPHHSVHWKLSMNIWIRKVIN